MPDHRSIASTVLTMLKNLAVVILIIIAAVEYNRVQIQNNEARHDMLDQAYRNGYNAGFTDGTDCSTASP